MLVFHISTLNLLFLIILTGLTYEAQSQIIQNFDCQNGCCDEHEWCSFWGTIGECDNNRFWMSHNCKITCNTCPGGKQARPKPNQRESKVSKKATTLTTRKTTKKLPIKSTIAPAIIEETATEQGILPNPPPPAESPIPSPQESIPQSQVPVAAPVVTERSLGNDQKRCKEIKDTQLGSAITQMIKDGLISDKEDTSFKPRSLSLTDIFTSNSQSSCAPSQEVTDCNKNICYNLRYRTMDGTCNNFQNPFFGAAAIAFIHHRTPVYDDGIQALTGSIRQDRPSTRDVSRLLLSSTQPVLSSRLNTLVMQFGQFVVHDIAKTSLLGTEQCVGCTTIQGRCNPIIADTSDPRFGCFTPPCCMSFTRAASICGTGTSSSLQRTQLNENTAYLDASMIYGSSATDNDRLRNGAFLRTTVFNGQTFLPFATDQCVDVSNCAANFDAGDNRITLFVGLAAYHTLFLREHNRIAGILQQQNPSWTPDRVFQETRKIVGAEIQAIAYKEWLPNVLGVAFDSRIGPYKGYDDSVDPSIASEFAHAAMRFGHGMIQESFARLNENGQSIFAGSLQFEDGVLKPSRLLFEGGVDAIIRGMMAMPLKRPQRVTPSVTDKMFGSTDLVAINLQRGRDVGLPSYNEWREFCGLSKAQTFDDLSNEISDGNIRSVLQSVYKTPDVMDLYAAVLLEDPVDGGLIGPTAACLVGRQFKRIRDGDRFWFQNPATFTSDQLSELEKVTFARIICDNGDNFKFLAPKVFELATGSNTAVFCSSVPAMDLSKWKE